MEMNRKVLAVMVFPYVIGCRVAVQVKIRSLEEAREQGNNRGGCVEAAHRGLFY